jgi:hypothetical protein
VNLTQYLPCLASDRVPLKIKSFQPQPVAREIEIPWDVVTSCDLTELLESVGDSKLVKIRETVQKYLPSKIFFKKPPSSSCGCHKSAPRSPHTGDPGFVLSGCVRPN